MALATGLNGKKPRNTCVCGDLWTRSLRPERVLPDTNISRNSARNGAASFNDLGIHTRCQAPSPAKSAIPHRTSTGQKSRLWVFTHSGSFSRGGVVGLVGFRPLPDSTPKKSGRRFAGSIRVDSQRSYKLSGLSDSAAAGARTCSSRSQAPARASSEAVRSSRSASSSRNRASRSLPATSKAPRRRYSPMRC